jgi:DNA-binding NarL/FixJ family response regulator
MIAPLTRVLVLTISDQDADVMDAILAGACGYLLKDSTIDELMAGIAAAATASRSSRRDCGEGPQRLRATEHLAARRGDDPFRALRREIQVLKLIANGKDNAMIAAELHISPKTSRTTSRTS